MLLTNPKLLAAQVLFPGSHFLVIGPQKMFDFFAQRNKLRETVCFLCDVVFVFLKWPTISVLLEMVSFLTLSAAYAWIRVIVHPPS